MAEQKEGANLEGKPDAGDQEREAFLRKMAELYDQMLEHVGVEGESFDEIEEQALGMGKEASRELMAHRLSAEEAGGQELRRCPRCGHPLRRPGNATPRNLETCAGVVPYERRHAYCDRCRQSFSPSGQTAEDSAPGLLQPPDPQDLRGQ